MTHPHILIAGIGNIFLGDDAFGVEVVRRLAARPMPAGVDVVDFGIRGLDLAYALLDGYKTVILVDAAPRGQQPGTLYVIEPEIPTDGAELDTHSMTPVKVLHLAKALGGALPRVLLVGCEPVCPGDPDDSTALSEPVRLAVDHAVSLVEALLSESHAAGSAPGWTQCAI